MPLIHSKSKKAIGKNIEIEKEAHPEMKPKQRVAIALNVARKAGADIKKPKGKASKSEGNSNSKRYGERG